MRLIYFSAEKSYAKGLDLEHVSLKDLLIVLWDYLVFLTSFLKLEKVTKVTRNFLILKLWDVFKRLLK